MTTAQRTLTDAELLVDAAWRALCAARDTANRCPSAANIAAEEDCERQLNLYLERLPRQRETTC